ncbi:MAG: penicillin acylase family protein [Desulfobacterales bacterium]
MKQRERMIAQNLKKINADIRMGSYAWAVAAVGQKAVIPFSIPVHRWDCHAFLYSGRIRAGRGINMSGMFIPGIPGMIIGRTPHHAWSMQVGHAHTSDYYFESPEDVTLDRMETIKVAGGADVTVPVFKTVHGPVINPMPYNPQTYMASADNPIIAWKYANRTYEFRNIEALLDMARAESMDDFGRAIDKVATSMHLCYADKDGNIAYWMSGRDPVRPAGEYRFPQGFLPGVPVAEWDAAVVRPCSTDRNTSKGYYTGWNNKSSAEYDSSYNNLNYTYGIFHRGHLLEEYFSSHEKVSFEQLRDLALHIAATDTFGVDSNKNLHAGGNPWAFVSSAFSAAVQADSTMERIMALAVMNNWDGHFVNGGSSQWAGGTDRADAWMLSDAWIQEVLRLTFADELGEERYEAQSSILLFNVMLHALAGETSAIVNQYDWFQNTADENAPQTASAIIVTALDNALAQLGIRPWGTGKREETVFKHAVLGQVHAMPFSNRSTYAHCVEMGPKGPVRIESMFPLGESGFIGMNADGTPAFDPHFFSMTGVFDTFVYREFPLFD